MKQLLAYRLLIQACLNKQAVPKGPQAENIVAVQLLNRFEKGQGR